MLTGSYCPGSLYPFAREAIADIVTRGGFPQLLLQPINFDALYAQALRERASGNGGEQAAPAPEGQQQPEETH
jgi:preprotein translocase subunit SecB